MDPRKLDGTLSEMESHGALTSEEPLWVVVSCQAAQKKELHRALQELGGTVTDRLRHREQVQFYVKIRKHSVSPLSRLPFVEHIGAVERYSPRTSLADPSKEKKRVHETPSLLPHTPSTR